MGGRPLRVTRARSGGHTRPVDWNSDVHDGEIVRCARAVRCRRQIGNTPVRTRLPRWRRSADRTRLHENSLLTGNFTGKITILWLSGSVSGQERPVPQRFFAKFPTQRNREIILDNRECFYVNREFIQAERLVPGCYIMILRCSAVRLPDEVVISFGVPAATTCPPSSPAPGPISMTQSLAATTLMSCSTTITVLPVATSP